MGGEASKRQKEVIQLIEDYPFRQKAISEQEFVNEIFCTLDM